MSKDKNTDSNGFETDLIKSVKTNENAMLSFQGCIQVPYTYLIKNGYLDLSKCLELNSRIICEFEYIQGILVLRIHLHSNKMTLYQLGQYFGVPQEDTIFLTSKSLQELQKNHKIKYQKIELSLVNNPPLTTSSDENSVNYTQRYDPKNKTYRHNNRIIIIGGRGTLGFFVNIAKLLYYCIKTVSKLFYETIKFLVKFLTHFVVTTFKYSKSLVMLTNKTRKKCISHVVHTLQPDFIPTSILFHPLPMVCSYYTRFELSGNIFISLNPHQNSNTYQMQTTLYLLGQKSENDAIRKFLETNAYKYKITKTKLDIPFKMKNKYGQLCNATILSKYLHLSNEFLPVLNKYYLNKSDLLFTNEISRTQTDIIPLGHKIIEGVLPLPLLEISLKDLTSHMGIFGITGFGKSRFIYHYLHMLYLKDIKFLVFDVKGEYLQIGNKIPFRYFQLAHPEFNIQLDIFKVPEGVTKADHVTFLETVFYQVIGDTITPQQNMLLHVGIKEVVYNNGNFKEFAFLLKNQLSRSIVQNSKKEYLNKELMPHATNIEQSVQGLLNKILPLMTGPAGTCFNVNTSNIDFETITHSNVVIDLSIFERNYNESARKFFVNTFYYYFINHLSNRQGSVRNRGDITNVLVVEEAQRIMKSSYIGKTEIHSLLGSSPQVARAAGVSLAFVANDIDLESPILTNTAINILFFNKYDIYTTSRLLNLSMEEYKKMFSIITEPQYYIASVNGKSYLCRTFNYALSENSTS